MKQELKLFSINRGLSTNVNNQTDKVCTPELCLSNFSNGIETNIFLDTNIISAIRKFSFKEESLDSRIHAIINQLIEIFNKLPHVYISPGLAFYECSDDLRDKNIRAFNEFIHNHVPKSKDAYNHLSYRAPTKQEDFYLLQTWASLFAIQYINKNYSNLPPFSKFEKFLELIQTHLVFIDALICEIAKYAFADSNKLSETHKKNHKKFRENRRHKEAIPKCCIRHNVNKNGNDAPQKRSTRNLCWKD